MFYKGRDHYDVKGLIAWCAAIQLKENTMPKLTYLIAIDLDEDEWLKASQMVKAQPLQGIFECALAEAGIKGTVKASFDGRAAPRVKAEPSANGKAILHDPVVKSAATVATEAG